MSTVKSKKIQLGTDATSSNNFTIYQPATPDGTLRIGVGNADSPTEVGRFDSNGYVATNAPAFSAYMTNGSAGISTGAATFTKIILDTEEFDTASCFDSSTNYRFTPTVAGYYQINAAVTYTVAASTAGAGAVIYKNGSGLCWGTASGTSNMYPTAFLSSLIYLNGSTDYIELYIYNGTGATSSTSYGRSYCYMNGFLARAV